MKQKVNFFFRKPSEHFHSIEELFANFQSFLPPTSEYRNVYLPYHTGIINRLKNILFVRKKQTHINHITGDTNYIALGLPRSNTVLTIHDIGSALNGNFLKKTIIKLFWFKLPMRRVSAITVISEFSKAEILDNFNINPNKITVIPNCVSNKISYVDREFNADNPKILIIGTKTNKNTIRAFEALKNISCEVIIVGKLTEEQRNKLLTNEIKYRNYFNIEYEKIISLYNQSDILLFPSTYEGFGVPIIEAQASGIPVITSNIAPMNKVAGKGALLVNPYEIKEIENAIKEITKNEELRKTLIHNGLKNVEQYKSYSIAKKYDELYKKIKSKNNS